MFPVELLVSFGLQVEVEELLVEKVGVLVDHIVEQDKQDLHMDQLQKDITSLMVFKEQVVEVEVELVEIELDLEDLASSLSSILHK